MREFVRRVAARSRAQESLRTMLAGVKQSVNRRRALRFIQSSTRRTPLRVLVILNGGIGNAVEATPLLQAIHTHWPDAGLDLVTRHARLFKSWCLPSSVGGLLNRDSGRAWDHTFLPWSSTLPDSDLATSDQLGHVHTVPLLGAWFVKPEREYNLDMIRALGYRGPTPPLHVSVTDPGSWSPEPGIRVALVPGGLSNTKWRTKHWPHFETLIQSLLNVSLNTRVYILGGPDDPDPSHHAGDPRVVDMRGRWELDELAWVFRQMHAVVGNDCGPMHIADAVRAPTVTLFGPTCELKNGPLHGGRVLAGAIDCRPCQFVNTSFTCSDPRCLSDLPPDDVLRCVQELLSTADPGLRHPALAALKQAQAG